MRNPVIIDGVDFSTDFNKYGYSVRYEIREGTNGGMMLDGSMMVDILARKAVVVLPCNDLTGDRLAALLQATLKAEISVTFLDTKLNAQRTATFINPELSDQTLTLQTVAGVRWYSGMTLTLTEK